MSEEKKKERKKKKIDETLSAHHGIAVTPSASHVPPDALDNDANQQALSLSTALLKKEPAFLSAKV